MSQRGDPLLLHELSRFRWNLRKQFLKCDTINYTIHQIVSSGVVVFFFLISLTLNKDLLIIWPKRTRILALTPLQFSACVWRHQSCQSKYVHHEVFMTDRRGCGRISRASALITSADSADAAFANLSMSNCFRTFRLLPVSCWYDKNKNRNIYLCISRVFFTLFWLGFTNINE